jgi:hypothetical protein
MIRREKNREITIFTDGELQKYLTQSLIGYRQPLGKCQTRDRSNGGEAKRLSFKLEADILA